jgi:hypothetical protein
LRKSEVEKEKHLEKVVERNPGNEPLCEIFNTHDTGKHRPIHQPSLEIFF